MKTKFSLTGVDTKEKQLNSFVDAVNEIEQPGIFILNRVSLFLLLVCIVFLIPFHFSSSLSLTGFFVAEALAFALIPILARKGFVNTAKVLQIAYINIGIIILSSVFGDQAMVQAFFIPCMGLSILLFDGKNIIYRNLTILMSVVSYFVLDYVIFDQISFSIDGFSIIRWSILTASFITTWLIFNTFSEFKESAENKASELLSKEIELNQELNFNQKKLEQNIEELEKARAELEKSTKAKSEFLATMSHEIRTPMNAIMGMTHLLQKDEPRQDQLEPLSILDFSGKTLLSLIDDVLDFSKIEAGKVEFEHIEFDLSKLTRSIIESFREIARNKKIDLDLVIGDSVHRNLIGDPSRLTQIINNLLSNALKFTEKGKVELSIKTKQDWKLKTELFFEVSDTGIGMEKNRLNTIFESFTQADGNTKRLYGGTGLGLTISKQLTELQGGELEVDSELEKGSTFSVTLQFKKADNKQDSIDTQAMESAVEMSLKGMKVLLAEDNLVNQKVMQRFFERWEATLEIVNNGQEVVNEVKKASYDIVLMDLQMPVMDGYEAATMIRKFEDPSKGRIPIVALTAAALTEVREKVFACGMNDFITKPFNPNELKQKLADLVIKN